MVTRRRTVLLLLLAASAACSESTGPGPAARLAFEVQPAPVGPGLPFAPTVVVGIEDDAGRLVPDWQGSVTVTLAGGGGSGALEGATSQTPEDGLAAFTGLTVSAPGKGYRLVARSAGLPEEWSASFDLPEVFHAERVYAGEALTCALAADSTAWCWGANEHGQLGDGTTQNRPLPTLLSSALHFASLSLGARHSCGLTDGGAAYCWGSNDSGQFGTGTPEAVLTPRAISLPGPAVSLAAGHAHTCAVVQGGAAYCWGYNAGGLLGTGSADSVVSTPEPVVGGLSFASITVGYNASCALTPAGIAYCWGDNQEGAVGDSSSEDRSTPTPVAGGHVFRWIRSAGSHWHSKTCGLAEDGKNYCWGRDGHEDHIPAEIPGDPGFESVVPGGRALCGITTAQALYCWGQPVALGNGVVMQYLASPMPVFADHGVVSVAVSLSYTHPSHICVVTTEGETWCWGPNTSGQLGNPSNPAGWLVPVPVWASEP
jgi:alpha-tubulin suppressor-like RCC1 family protein